MEKYEKIAECAGNTKQKVEDFFESDWTVKEKSLIIAVALLIGVVIGFLISPVKRGMFSGNKIGSDNIGNICDDEDDDEY